ncbi:MAG: hypothetical protein ACRDXD_07650 [Acidimicrobiia bacterium]
MSDRPDADWDPVMLLDYLTTEDRVADDLVLEIRRRVIDRNRILVGITALEPVLVDLRSR